MDAAKATVKKFIGKSGQHDTTVHEHVAPAVQHENITRTEHENVMPVVNREVHQDHHHTTVQPISHSETLPEQHHHKTAAVEHRSFEHGNKDEVAQRLEAERAQFSHQTQHTEGQHTSSAAPVVVGEQKHHHVHEMIQPIVQKETVEPHVVHHTVPVHETHHNEALHHSGTTLPAMTMGEFSQLGGSLKGREEHVERYSGEPQMQRDLTGASGSHGHTGHHHNNTNTGLEGHPAGPEGSGLHNTTGHNTSGLNTTSHNATGHNASGLNTTGRDTVGRDTIGRDTTGRDTIGRDTTGRNTTGHNATGHDSTTSGSTHNKPSIMDKLDPRKDADGDGKAGFMK